jgi:cytochrome c553
MRAQKLTVMSICSRTALTKFSKIGFLESVPLPEDLERFENRDSRSQFIAYMPIGSIAKGAALVSTGGAGKTLQCAICHGQDLKGLGGIHSIAGRSPSYVVRQLYGDCDRRVRRGASFCGAYDQMRSSSRRTYQAGARGNQLGFRLVRKIE